MPYELYQLDLSHFADEEIKAHWCYITCSRSQSGSAYCVGTQAPKFMLFAWNLEESLSNQKKECAHQTADSRVRL